LDTPSYVEWHRLSSTAEVRGQTSGRKFKEKDEANLHWRDVHAEFNENLSSISKIIRGNRYTDIRT
jgi:hypothetical protein